MYGSRSRGWSEVGGEFRTPSGTRCGDRSDVRPGRRTFLVPLAAVCCLSIGTAREASAHKMFVSAVAQAERIEGEVYVVGGEPVEKAVVSLLATDGTELGKATTGSDGKFSFVPRFRCDHRLVVDGGFGHRAECTVSANELPAALPAYSAEGALRLQQAPAAADADAVSGGAMTTAGVDDVSQREALSQQIAALRMDLDKWKSELRFQDILGGVGYILGLTGLVFYFLGIRAKDRRSRSKLAAPQQD